MIARFVTAAVWLLLVSCGVVGPPVAPENVGVALTVERQKQRDAREAEQQKASTGTDALEPDPATQGQEIELPPLRPVGTR